MTNLRLVMALTPFHFPTPLNILYMLVRFIQLTVNEYLKGLSHCSQDSHTGTESRLIKNPPNTYEYTES